MTPDKMIVARELQEPILDHYVTEKFLINQMEWLDSSGEIVGSVNIYWLSLSRVMELALLCAGNYADLGFAREVGDLLANPRHSEIHIDGLWEPVRVKRHVRMTEQFAEYVPAYKDVREWFRDHTHLVHVTGPLIPTLYDRLKGEDVLSQPYLSSICLRIQKISEALTFVMQGQIMDPNYPFCGVYPDEKEWVEANLCRFDRKIFDQLGNDIDELKKDKNYNSSFLKNRDNVLQSSS